MVFDCINERVERDSHKIRYADFENQAEFNAIKALYHVQLRGHQTPESKRMDLEEFEKIFLIPQTCGYKDIFHETISMVAPQAPLNAYLKNSLLKNEQSLSFASLCTDPKGLLDGGTSLLALKPFCFQKRYKHIEKPTLLALTYPAAPIIDQTASGGTPSSSLIEAGNGSGQLQTKASKLTNADHMELSKLNLPLVFMKVEKNSITPHVEKESSILHCNKPSSDETKTRKPPKKPSKSLDINPKASKYVKHIMNEQLPQLWSEAEWVQFANSTKLPIDSPFKKSKASKAVSKVTPSDNGCARIDGYLSHIKNKLWSRENDAKDMNWARSFLLLCEPDFSDAVACDVPKRFLFVTRSCIHFWGLFTSYQIEPNDLIVYYQGELISSRVAFLREQYYTKNGIGSSYLFRCDDNYVVDATAKGNIARFMNHSCDPNSYAVIINDTSGGIKIGIYAKKHIDPWQEITYDYKFPIEEFDKLICHCRAPTCRGYLN